MIKSGKQDGFILAKNRREKQEVICENHHDQAHI